MRVVLDQEARCICPGLGQDGTVVESTVRAPGPSTGETAQGQGPSIASVLVVAPCHVVASAATNGQKDLAVASRLERFSDEKGLHRT